MRILWGYCPPEVRGALRPILVDYLFLLPPWCRTLYVAWDGSPEEATTAAYTTAQVEYRQAQIHVCPGWLAAVPHTRRMQVAHELLHVPLTPMVEEQSDLLRRLLNEGDAPQFHGYAQEQWRRAFESSVQDLAASVASLPGPFPTVAFEEVEDDDGAAAAA